MTDGRWLSWGATVIGPGHMKRSLPNQDAWEARHYRWGNVLSVSDGVGSCSHAHVGSLAACRSVAQAALSFHRNSPADAKDLLRLIYVLWRMAISPLPPKDCSATCLFVIREQGGMVYLGMLGDGLVAACRTDGGINLFFEEKEDSFSNITVGMASGGDPAIWRLVAVPEREYCAFVLCTDGIADDLVPELSAEFSRQVYLHYREIPRRRIAHDIRRWLRAWPVPGHTDDKTIACLYRKNLG